MENNSEETKLKIEKIHKYKKEKNIYNAVKVIASIFAGLGMIVSGYVLYEGIKGNGKYGPIVSILAGLFGLSALALLDRQLIKESNEINKEYDKEISILEEEIKVR